MTHETESSVTLMFLSYLDVIGDLLLNRYTTKNLSSSWLRHHCILPPIINMRVIKLFIKIQIIDKKKLIRIIAKSK